MVLWFVAERTAQTLELHLDLLFLLPALDDVFPIAPQEVINRLHTNADGSGLAQGSLDTYPSTPKATMGMLLS